MRKTDAVVQRQPAVHLPVVLDVALGVVVEHAALNELRGLQVLVVYAKNGVRIAVAGVERVVGVVGEVNIPLEGQVGDATGADVLRFEAVVVVEAALEGMAAGNPGQRDRDVLRPVDVSRRFYRAAGVCL